MSEHVWLSRATADGSLVGQFDTDIWVGNEQVAIQAEKLNVRGQPVPAADNRRAGNLAMPQPLP